MIGIRGRLSFVFLVSVAGALTYPWPTATQRWLLVAGFAVAIAVLARWHGRFLTTLCVDSLRILMRSRVQLDRPAATSRIGNDITTAVVIRVADGTHDLSMDLLAGQLDRYGIRCRSVRVGRHQGSAGDQVWISLLFSAADNLAALQGRSAEIPLHATAHVAGRRVVDELCELGCSAALVDPERVPRIATGEAKELWNSIACDEGFVTVYSVEDPSEAHVSAGQESWTVWEIVGPVARPRMTAGVALRTPQRPGRASPAPGLTTLVGRQMEALSALDLLSTSTVR